MEIFREAIRVNCLVIKRQRQREVTAFGIIGAFFILRESFKGMPGAVQPVLYQKLIVLSARPRKKHREIEGNFFNFRTKWNILAYFEVREFQLLALGKEFWSGRFVGGQVGIQIGF